MLLFSLKMCKLAFLSLGFILSCHQHLHLLFVLLLFKFIVTRRLLDISSVIVLDFEFSDLLLFLLVRDFQIVILLLICADSEEKLRVGLFFGHEFLDYFSNIWVIGLRSDLLEALLDVFVARHHFTHPLLEVGGPESIDEKELTFLDFDGILGLISGNLTYFSLFLRSSQTLL